MAFTDSIERPLYFGSTGSAPAVATAALVGFVAQLLIAIVEQLRC